MPCLHSGRISWALKLISVQAISTAVNVCVRNQMSALTTENHIASNEEPDPRDPVLRLAQLFDGGEMAPLHGDGGIEVRTVVGRINGARAVAYCVRSR